MAISKITKKKFTHFTEVKWAHVEHRNVKSIFQSSMVIDQAVNFVKPLRFDQDLHNNFFLILISRKNFKIVTYFFGSASKCFVFDWKWTETTRFNNFATYQNYIAIMAFGGKSAFRPAITILYVGRKNCVRNNNGTFVNGTS